MRVVRRDDGDVVLLAFNGEIDGESLAAGIQEIIEEVIHARRSGLVLNLAGVSFLDSWALAYVIKTRKRIEAFGGELVVSQPSRFFQAVSRTLELGRIFRIFPSDEEAVEYLRGPWS